jgi:mRNA interferase YafQ
MILAPDPSFKRSLKRLTRKNPQLKEKVSEILDLLSADPFTPSLKSHKLTGQLDGWWSCSVSYDCRIIFGFEQDLETGEERILLIDIGSHDEVY